MRALIISMLLAGQLLSSAQSDVQARIDIASTTIQEDPTNAGLLVKRANLFIEVEALEKAIVDLETAKNIAGEEFPPLLISSAHLNHIQGNSGLALPLIDRFLETEGINVRGFKLKAQILEELGDKESAIDFYKKVLVHTRELRPQDYLSVIDLLKEESRWNEAIFYCKSAMKIMGHLSALDTRLIELHQLNGDYTLALSLTDRLIERSQRKEQLYYERAMICKSAGDHEGYIEALQLSKHYIQQLNEAVRNSATIKVLSVEIQAALNSTER